MLLEVIQRYFFKQINSNKAVYYVQYTACFFIEQKLFCRGLKTYLKIFVCLFHFIKKCQIFFLLLKFLRHILSLFKRDVSNHFTLNVVN